MSEEVNTLFGTITVTGKKKASVPKGHSIGNHKVAIQKKLLGKADVSENDLYALGQGNEENILEILLRDQTRGKMGDKYAHIIWATDNYCKKYGYYTTHPIRVEDIVGKNGRVLRPRALKSKEEQRKRTKDKAEVFTPSWVCNAQNNLVDEAWFGYANVFNTEHDNHTWQPTEHVEFRDAKKTWQMYVKEERLEITCGEAPYLVSRYDTTTGECLPLNSRIGLLDRKFRVIKENLIPDPNKSVVDNTRYWREWAYKAIKSTYGFEWQGDSLLLARENILVSFIEYFYDYCEHYQLKADLNATSIAKAALFISWNIWQMDGIRYIIPYSDQPLENTGLFENQPQQEQVDPNGVLAKIAIWKERGRDEIHDTIEFKSLINQQ